MKTQLLSLILISFVISAAGQAPPVYQAPTPTPAPAAATPAPPPSAPPKRSAADLEKLVAPIALYPDPLIATVLMASVYPLEVVQAARFVANTNNLAQLDAQPWDDNVKSVARVPEAIKKMNDEISWTIELGEAFLAQDKDVMDAIQTMRGKAQKAGTLQTNPQQTVVVTNMVVEKTIEQQVVVVTNTVVQIQPSSPSVVYVPSYNPYTVYYPPPAYVYDPIAPLITFGAGMAMGAIIANNCNWYGGGCYHGDVDIDVNSNRNVNRNTNRNTDRASARSTGSGQKWQPDQNRLSKSGAPGVSNSARSNEARGWSGSNGARPSAGNAAARPSTGTSGARPSAGNTGARPNTGSAATRPSTGTPSGNRPAASPAANRPSPSPSTSQSRPSSSASRPSSSSGSAFSGVSSGASARDSSSRGSSSRGGGGGGGRGGGGGGRRR